MAPRAMPADSIFSFSQSARGRAQGRAAAMARFGSRLYSCPGPRSLPLLEGDARASRQTCGGVVPQ